MRRQARAGKWPRDTPPGSTYQIRLLLASCHLDWIVQNSWQSNGTLLNYHQGMKLSSSRVGRNFNQKETWRPMRMVCPKALGLVKPPSLVRVERLKVCGPLWWLWMQGCKLLSIAKVGWKVEHSRRNGLWPVGALTCCCKFDGDQSRSGFHLSDLIVSWSLVTPCPQSSSAFRFLKAFFGPYKSRYHHIFEADVFICVSQGIKPWGEFVQVPAKFGCPSPRRILSSSHLLVHPSTRPS